MAVPEISTQDLWLPELAPPKVSYDARVEVDKRLATDGLNTVVRSGLRRLSNEHEPYLRFLKSFGTALNQISTEGPWPEHALRIGAALAVVAYHETGFFQAIDETATEVGIFAVTHTDTEVPGVFSLSADFDKQLGQLIEHTLQESLPIDPDGGTRQVITIGAGCTRYFLQRALAA